jgi:hypothetical protein
MCQGLQIFAFVYAYWGANCLVRLCDSEFGIIIKNNNNNNILLLLLLLLYNLLTACQITLSNATCVASSFTGSLAFTYKINIPYT